MADPLTLPTPMIRWFVSCILRTAIRNVLIQDVLGVFPRECSKVEDSKGVMADSSGYFETEKNVIDSTVKMISNFKDSFNDMKKLASDITSSTQEMLESLKAVHKVPPESRAPNKLAEEELEKALERLRVKDEECKRNLEYLDEVNKAVFGTEYTTW